MLLKIAKEKGNEGLSCWIQPCANHLHWSAITTFSGNGSVIWAKFKSFLGHIINKHAGHSDPLFNKCNHAQEIPARKWLRPGKIISRIEKSTQYNLSKANHLFCKKYGILDLINKCQN